MQKSAKRRVVVDSNVFVSRLLFQNSAPGRAVELVTHNDELLLSLTLLNELADIVSRRKFDRYVTIADRNAFLRAIYVAAQIVVITCHVQACRDPKDNTVLELALSGRADLIVTGGSDLLSLGTFQTISIVTPATYIDMPQSE